MSLTARLRTLFQRRDGTMPPPRALAPDEARATLSPGWNGPIVETSANFTGRGLNAYRKPPTT